MENINNYKKIGNVIIDYTMYLGKDLYSDGKIEEVLLDACKNKNEKKLLKNSRDWPILYHLSDIRENVLEWYPFEEDAEILEIGSGCGGITGVLSQKVKSVTCVELSERRSLINAYRHQDKNNIMIKLGNFQDIEPKLGKYDYITLIGVLEYSKLYIKCEENSYEKLLKIVKCHLKENGKLIIAIENKMGIKYWNGATEDHTGKMYSGINDYIENTDIRTFSSKEMQVLLNNTGYEEFSFYFPIPDYKLPQIIFSDKFSPNPGAIRTYKKVYSRERVYNFYEDVVCDQLCSDGMFDYMSNSFVIVAGNSVDAPILYAKYNRERKEKYRIATLIKQERDKTRVIKKALSEKAIEHIMEIKKNEKLWCGSLKNIKCINGTIENNTYISEFIIGMTFDEMMYKYRNNIDLFISKVSELVNNYLIPEEEALIDFKYTKEFENIYGKYYPKNAKSMKVSNADILFGNLILSHDGTAFAFDFEWVFTFPIPYKYLVWRVEKEIYIQYQVYLKSYISLEDYLKRLGNEKEEIEIYNLMEKSFGEYVYGKNLCEKYITQYEKTVIMQNTRFL